MKRLIFPLLISLIATIQLISPAHATVNAIVLTDVEITANQITSDEDLELKLKFRTPKTFNWNPTLGLPSGDVQIIYCPEESLSETTCTFPSHISNFRLQNIDQYSSQEFADYLETLVVIKGKINSGAIGSYKLWSIRISGADLPYRYELHVYTRGKLYAEELTLPRTDIAVPDISSGDISIVESVVLESEPDPVVEPVVPTVEPAPPQPAQRVLDSSPSVSSSAPISAVVQANFYLPALKGDENWRPMKEIKGSFQDWRRLKKNALNGGMNQVTKTNGALITFKSSGDALSLRYMGGKKRGSFSIYVNGKFLDRVNAGKKKKTQLVKTWDGLGKGPHFIDIVAELKPGQSMAINGIQKPRA